MIDIQSKDRQIFSIDFQLMLTFAITWLNVTNCFRFPFFRTFNYLFSFPLICDADDEV